MTRILAALILLFGLALPVQAATVNAASCTVADITAAIAKASSGDTVSVPAGTCAWSAPGLVLTANIVLQGAGSGTSGTIIQDNTTITSSAGALLNWTAVTGGTAHRLTGFRFVQGTRTSRTTNPLMLFTSTSASSTRFRIDHNQFGDGTTAGTLRGNVMRMLCFVGVIDNNVFYTGDNMSPTAHSDQAFEPECPSLDGAGLWGDKSWAVDSNWGDNSAPYSTYIESNVIRDLRDDTKACFDGNYGYRVVFRFNGTAAQPLNCTIQGHGTETGRYRGYLTIEAYMNTFDFASASGSTILGSNRGSKGLWFLNTAANMSGTPKVMRFFDYLTTTPYLPWTTLCTSGSVCDLGSGLNRLATLGSRMTLGPYTVASAAAPPTKTITITTTPWTANQLQAVKGQGGYFVHVLTVGGGATPCVPVDPSTVPNSSSPFQSCAAPVSNNTSSSTLEYGNGSPQNPLLGLAAGDTIELVSIAAMPDGPGRSTGRLLEGGDASSLSGATCGGAVCTTYASNALNQTWEPTYEWLNTLNGSTTRGVTVNDSGVATVLEDEAYYIFKSSFSGASGVGTGARTARPVTCTAGVAYWSTDEGGDWDTTSADTEDGALDLCSAKDTWIDDWYIPLEYPYSLAASTPPNLDSITPSSGAQGATVPITLAGTALNGASPSIAVSGTGVTVNTIVQVSEVEVTANFVIDAMATNSTRTVTFTADGIASNTVNFTVTGASGPTLTSIAPSVGYRGAAIPVTLVGTNLNGASPVLNVCTGMTVSGLTVASATLATATLTLTATAPLSQCAITFTTADGTSGSVAFQPLSQHGGPGGAAIF